MPILPFFPLWARALIYFVGVLLMLRPLWQHPSECPFGLHDWTFACFPEQRKDFFLYWISPWNPENLGTPQARPAVEPPLLMLAAAATLWPSIALRLFLFLCFWLAALAADSAAGSVFKTSSPLARLTAGLVYLASPFFGTKLVGGHLGFIACAPLIPWVLTVLATSDRPGGRWARVAAGLSATFAQLQVGLVCFFLLPLVAWRLMKIQDWLRVMPLAGVTWAPGAFAGLIAYTSGGLASEIQLRTWWRDESVPWLHVLDGTAYFAHYTQLMSTPVALFAWQIGAPIFVCCSLLVSGLPRRLAIAAIALGGFASGLTGPFAGAAEWLIANVRVTTLFRELYDLLFLAPIVVAGGAAVAVETVLRLTPGWIRSVGLGALLIFAALTCWPILTAGFAQQIPLQNMSPWSSQARDAAREMGGARLLWLPAAIPLGPKNTPGGADPFIFSFGSQQSANAYHPTGLFSYATAKADHSGRLDQWFLRRLGIGKIFVRRGIVSRRLSAAAHPLGQNIELPQNSETRVLHSGPLAISDGQPQCEPDLRSDLRANIAYVRCRVSPQSIPLENAAVSNDDPQHEWVAGERWAELDPELAAPRWPVLFTVSLMPYNWSTSSDGAAWIYTTGPAWLDKHSLRGRPGWRLMPLRGGSHTLRGSDHHVLALSATVQYPVAVGAQRSSEERELPAETYSRFWGRYTAKVPAHRDSFLIVRESFSEGWRAEIGGEDIGPPELADGYALGWHLKPSAAQSSLVVYYAPRFPYALLCALAALAWLAILGSMILASRFQKQPIGQGPETRP